MFARIGSYISSAVLSACLTLNTILVFLDTCFMLTRALYRVLKVKLDTITDYDSYLVRTILRNVTSYKFLANRRAESIIYYKKYVVYVNTKNLYFKKNRICQNRRLLDYVNDDIFLHLKTHIMYNLELSDTTHETSKKQTASGKAKLP